MQTQRPSRGPSLLPMILGAAVCVVVGVGIWLVLQPPPQPVPRAVAVAPPVVPPAPTPVPPPAPPAVTTAPAAPSFDVVRVNPKGEAVVAGRAEPGSDVTLKENGTTIGEAKADAQGQFVILPAKPITPGADELSLASRNQAGAVTQGTAPVTVLMPTQVAPAATPIAPVAPVVVLTSPTEPPRLLQPPPGPAPRVSVDVVDYDAAGHIRFGGRATPGGVVRIYIDNAPAGDARADAAGDWNLMPPQEVTPGDHSLRLDLINEADGKVLARAEQPFTRASIPAIAAQPERVIVQPRQNLWRIARSTYGQGIRYIEIVAANRGQIRDPDLIYPGQVFTLPGATPASASTSR